MPKWMPVVYDEEGYVIGPETLRAILEGGEAAQEAYGQDLDEVVVVSGTALPDLSKVDEEFVRGPGSYNSLDKAFEEDLTALLWSEIPIIIRRAEIFAAALSQEDA